MDNTVKAIGAAVIGVLLLIFFYLTYFTVAQNERGVVTRFGKVSYIADPGLHFKMPFVNSVSYMRTDILSLQPQDKVNTYTEDNQEIDILFTVFYRLPADKIGFIYENAQDYRARLFNLANDRLKAEMGKVKLEHFALHRGEIRDRIHATLKNDSQVLGVDVTDFQFTDVTYTDAFRKAVEAASVQKAQVETREWELQQAAKVALTVRTKAEGEANAVREKAKGDADARLAVATAEAKAIKLEGEAKADAMRAQAEALMRNPVLVEMKKAENWNGALPTQMLSGITPFMQFTAPAGKAVARSE